MVMGSRCCKWGFCNREIREKHGRQGEFFMFSRVGVGVDIQ